jgi:hypothetical protein
LLLLSIYLWQFTKYNTMRPKRWGFLVLVLTFYQCDLDLKRGNGQIEVQEYEVGEFNELLVGGNYELVLIEARRSKVLIETDANLFRYINVENTDGTLHINNVHNLKGSDGILVEVYYQNLEKIASTGASSIAHEGVINSEEFSIELSGAGAVQLELNTGQVSVDMSGAGVVELSGTTDRQIAHLSGAGGLVAEELVCAECDITLSGLGGAEVYVTEKLTATITGIGGITYSGNPGLIERQVTGLGKIERNTEYAEEAM